MKKKDIIEAIYQNNEYRRQDVEDIVNQVFDITALGLKDDGKVMISNFGTFERVFQDSYMGVHPITGEPQKVKGAYRIRFTSSKNLKTIINDNND